MKNIQIELVIFSIIGICTVIIDYVFYMIMLYIGLSLSYSKGIGFICGTIFAYFANKKFTFNYSESSKKIFSKFILLYFFSMLLNVVINTYILKIYSKISNNFLYAFIGATLSSAIVNYWGMKTYIFKKTTQ